MNRKDDIDDARAALIDQRIGQAFGFLGDVIEDSRLLDVLPDGSRLTFRDVTIGGVQFRLTAYQSPDAQGRWHALVTGCGSANAQDDSKIHRMLALLEGSGGSEAVASFTGMTAALALDALEVELRSLVTIPA